SSWLQDAGELLHPGVRRVLREVGEHGVANDEVEGIRGERRRGQRGNDLVAPTAHDPAADLHEPRVHVDAGDVLGPGFLQEEPADPSPRAPEVEDARRGAQRYLQRSARLPDVEPEAERVLEGRWSRAPDGVFLQLGTRIAAKGAARAAVRRIALHDRVEPSPFRESAESVEIEDGLLRAPRPDHARQSTPGVATGSSR